MTGDDYENVVAQSLYFEREISRYSQLVAQISSDVGLDHVPQLVIDEWNMRHLEPASWPEPRAGADGGIAEREIGRASCRERVWRAGGGVSYKKRRSTRISSAKDVVIARKTNEAW